MMEKRPLVLIVDDEKHIRVTLSEVIRGMGFEIVTASNGEDALKTLSSDNVWLTLLDLRLPAMDGIEVLRRGHELRPETVFVIVTAHGTVEVAVDAMKCGATDVLQKPFVPDQVRRLIQGIRQREKKREEETADYDLLIDQAVRAISMLDLDRARDLLDRALAADDAGPEVHNLRGVVYEAEGDQFSAQQSYRDALEVDPTYEPARSNLHSSVERDKEGSFMLTEAKKSRLWSHK